MLSLSVQITGLDAFVNQLASFDGQKVLGDAVERAADRIVSDVQDMLPVSAGEIGYGPHGIPVAPKYGGTLRQSIHSVRTGLLEAEVIPGVDYADFVHAGTVKMPARPFFQWVLEEFGGQQHIEDIVDTALSSHFA